MKEKKDLHLEHKADELDSWKGWISVGCTFAITFVCFGIVHSFGAFFDSISSDFSAGKSATSAVFAITTFISFIGGIVSGSLTDRFGPKPVLIFGGLSMGLGLYLTSLINSIWVGYVTYGLGVGIGVSCGYVPMLAVVGAWFEKRRATALGVAVTGVGFGTLLMAPLAANLINKYGWRHTYVIFGILSLVTLVVCGFITTRPPAVEGPEPKKTIGDQARTPVFRQMYFACFFVTLSIFIPFVFLISYAIAQGINEVAAASLMGIIGAASIVGRLGFGALGAKINSIRLYQMTFFLITISYVLWILALESYVMLVIFSLILGTGYGGFIVLSPTVTAELFGLAGLGSILGTLYTAAGFGGLLGPPMAGYLIDITGSYMIAIVASMILAFLAFIFLLSLERSTRR